ncbi:MAG TPA: aldo/keto reductase [Methylomirabilota bacterium]|nr:aldo/keto reductase [Methylomirabilota bacterium]
MDYRRLGESGVEVSTLCLGAMMFGDQTGEAEATRIVHQAREAGVNFIDTADAYAGGESERVVGRALRGERDRWIVATKGGTALAPHGPNRRGSGRVWLLRALEQSLARLGMDHVDIYYLHLDDLATPLEETVQVMGDLIRQGKIRHWGFSNFRGWRIAEIIRLCGVFRVPRPVVGQPYYNAMNRMPEVDYLPACAYYRIGVVPYSPLARGVLTGKYAPGAAPEPGTRAGRKDKRMMETEFRAESLAIARTIKAHAEARGSTAIGFALNWVLANPVVSSVIAGPRTEAHWAEYLRALRDPFDAEDEALLDRLVAAGHPSTPGYTDPLYPALGRPARR